MNVQFSSEQRMMRDMVRDFARQEVAQEVKRMEEEDRFPKELIIKMGSLGMMGIPIPEKYGGSGMDFTSYIIAIHELSKVSAALGVILSVHTSVGTNPILIYGNEEQKAKYLPKLTSGDYLGAFALTEAGAGSDAARIKTKAKKVRDTYILNGSKLFTTNGAEADTFITFARTEQDGSDGISAFIIEKGTKGFTIGKHEKKMGLHGSSTVELIFDECEVPSTQLLGEEGEGFKIALSNLNIGRIGIAAQALGIAESAVDHAVACAKEREQFGKAIASHQGLTFKLADMETKVEAARLLTYHAASLVERAKPSGKEVSMAKVFTSRAAVETAIEAVQIFGGYGYTEDYPAERLFRDAKVTEIYEGTSEIQRMVIRKHLLNT